MFQIEIKQSGEIVLAGRLDAAQAETAKKTFNTIQTTVSVNFKELEYISSAGLGVLLMTQKRLGEAGHSLKLKHLRKHIRDVFAFSGFDQIFEIEA